MYKTIMKERCAMKYATPVGGLIIGGLFGFLFEDLSIVFLCSIIGGILWGAFCAVCEARK